MTSVHPIGQRAAGRLDDLDHVQPVRQGSIQGGGDTSRAGYAAQIAASPLLTSVLTANQQLGKQAMTAGTTTVSAVVKAATDVEQYQQDLEAWDIALLANFSKIVNEIA